MSGYRNIYGNMDARELRIGNLVYDNENVIVWYEGNFELLTYMDMPDYYKPIPITEEWLLKFGFEIDWIISHKKEYFNLFQDGDKFFFTADQHHYTSGAIKYVHQLQNLYFALTNQELNVD